MHETSSVMVDPVTRAISCSQQGAPTQSDASKVVAKGQGLTKGFIGQKNSFSVDCSKAGVYDCDCDRKINVQCISGGPESVRNYTCL